MADAPIEVAPHFVFSEAVTDATPVHIIEQSIRERPEVFQRALAILGERATAGAVELKDITPKLTPDEKDASVLLVNFFKERLDHGTEFDDATEDALAADPAHRELIQRHRDAHNILIKLGEMTHASVENPNAAPARDAVRRSRMATFIARTYEYQRRNQAELPAAG